MPYEEGHSDLTYIEFESPNICPDFQKTIDVKDYWASLYDVAQRPKPADFWMNSTSRPFVYIRNRWPVIWHWADVSKARCDKPGFQLFKHFQATYLSYTNTLPWPDWVVDLRNKIKDERLNIGASVAELPETIMFFGTAVRQLHDAWRCIRKGKNCKRRKLNTKDVSATAIIADFVVLPAVDDVYNSVERLAGWSERPIRKRFIVSNREQDQFVDGDQVSVKLNKTVRAIAHVEFKHNIGEFTSGNILETAWELIPFSFIVDQMVPIGNYLSTIDSLLDVDRLEVTLTKKSTVYANTWGSFRGGDTQVNGYYEESTFERELMTSLPLAELPSYDPSSSFRSLWDNINLLNLLRKDVKRNGGDRVIISNTSASA